MINMAETTKQRLILLGPVLTDLLGKNSNVKPDALYYLEKQIFADWLNKLREVVGLAKLSG